LILKISDAATLGIHALVYLARHRDDDAPISTVQIARAYQVSENHLSKVMQRLARTGLVRSVRGPRGGFLLARQPEEIRLLDIYEAIDGALASGCHCMLGTYACGHEQCIFGNLARTVEQEVYDSFSRRTLKDITENGQLASPCR
jgi:Rrf2 family protein